MGRKTKSPQQSREEISDLLVEQTVQDCPLKRKGDIKVIVAWLHDQKPVAGVPVTLTGPTPGAGATDAQGQVTFKKRQPGGYSYEADFSGTQARMPVAVKAIDSASVKKDKLVTVFVYIEELGAIEISIIEKDGDAVVGPVPADIVSSIAAGGQSVAKLNKKLVERVPAGDVTFTVQVAGPEWLLVAGQDMTAVIKPGETTKKEIYAERQPWIAFCVRDADSGEDLDDGTLTAKFGGLSRSPDLETARQKLHFPKTAEKATIEHIETTVADADEEPLYEFVRMS